MDVGCDWSRLPGRGRPVDPRHLLVQEEQEKESEQRKSSVGIFAGYAVDLDKQQG